MNEFFRKLFLADRKKPRFLTIKIRLFTKSNKLERISKNLILKLYKTSKQFTAPTTSYRLTLRINGCKLLNHVPKATVPLTIFK